MEIAVLDTDWDETVEYYTRVFDVDPEPAGESRVLFRTQQFDLYLVKVASSSVGLIGEKFPPSYYNVDSEATVRKIYKQMQISIPDATPNGIRRILVFPVKDPQTSSHKAVVVTMASVTISPPSACKTQVPMELGVIHNPPY